jgi:Glycosyl transferase family 90
MLSWDHRHSSVFWSGEIILSPTRRVYNACSNRFKQEVVCKRVNWSKARGVYSTGPFASAKSYKPISMDSRQKLHYKFHIYIEGVTWSSSLKRMIGSGGVLILPDPNMHESFITKALDESCKHCYMTYSNHKGIKSTLCDELVSIVRNNDLNSSSNEINRRMASNLLDFERDVFSYNETVRYMYDTLVQLSLANRDAKSYIKRHNLKHYSCDVLRAEHRDNLIKILNKDVFWQYDEWYDSDCRMVFNSSYLNLLPA